MLECLTCRCKLIEAFQHLKCKYLVCRRCFYHFVREHNNNAFNRVSPLRNQITVGMRKLQRLLIRFVDSQKIGMESIYNDQIIDLYENHRSQKNQSQQLSTEYSYNESDHQQLEDRKILDLYARYNWVKQKLQANYATLRESKLGEKVVENLAPTCDKIIEKKNKIAIGLSYIKKQFNSLKKESPSLSELKKIDVGGFLRSKYRDFF